MPCGPFMTGIPHAGTLPLRVPGKRQGVLMDLGMRVLIACSAFVLLCAVLGYVGKRLSDE